MSLPSAAEISASTACADAGVGWCVARRIAGDVPNGELGFRFGEPLDVDGDGHADIAAGARFKLQQGVLQNGSASVYSGGSGAVIRAWDGEFPDGIFGHWVLPIADVGNDGLADVIIAAPAARVDGIVHGTVVVRSPKTGDELWRQTGSREENFGWDLSLAGDADGDGVSEIFVGAPSADGGRAYLVNGKDGRMLRTYAPQMEVETFGWYVARIDDLDGDDRGDLVVGAHMETDDRGARVGGVYVFSSGSGRLLYHWQGSGHLSGFGEVVAAVGDLDGDRKGEIVVVSPRTNDQTRSLAGEVHVYSGATGKEIRRWSGKQPGELFGRMVVAAGDLDGDGVEDLAVGAPWFRRDAATRVGRVELRSGRTGEVLSELFGDEADCWFGWHVRRAPDPDGLGRPTLLIGSLRHPVDGHAGVGVLDLYVLRREKSALDQGTIARGARLSDIK